MSLQDVLIDELRDLYSAENQLVKAMPKAAKSVESDAFKTILQEHMEQTKGQVERLRQVFSLLGKKPTGKHCEGMEGAIAEVKEALEEDEEGALKDCMILGGVTRVEHYEIAGYTVAVAIAKQLKLTEIANLLNETLKEEQAAAKNATNAGKQILKDAATQEEDDEEEDEDSKPKSPKKQQSEQESEQDEAEAASEIEASPAAKKVATKSAKSATKTAAKGAKKSSSK